jgi:fido (protein-threonine AMPylation protein)
MQTHEIWRPSTGIIDYEGDPHLLAASEMPGVKAVWADQRKRLQGSAQLQMFTERLNREWAIETGIIEDMYDIERGVTQTLIEHGFHAELLSHGSTNKPREFVLRLLRDQRDALEGIFDFVKSKRVLSVSYIKELQAALLRSQQTTEALDSSGRLVEVPLIKGDWKRQPNYPVRDGVIFTYCPPEHVASEMDRLIAMHSKHIDDKVPPEVEAAWLHHRFSQIHPFQDGNGRVARAVASLVLIKAGHFPLVVTRDDRANYISALETADSGEMRPLVDLFAKLQRLQFIKATAVSESLVSGTADVDAMIGDLARIAEKKATNKRVALTKVFSLAQTLEADVEARLREIEPQIGAALLQTTTEAKACVEKSTDQSSHYYRPQIIDNAKNIFTYFANLQDYKSWIALRLLWNRKACLVFAFHGIGRPFNGSLICAPFLEFQDKDDDGQTRSTLVPVAAEGFIFFYNEEEARLLARFRQWREQVLRVAVKELTRNL